MSMLHPEHFHVHGSPSFTEPKLQGFLRCLKANTNTTHLHFFIDSKSAIKLIKSCFSPNIKINKLCNRVTLKEVITLLSSCKLIKHTQSTVDSVLTIFLNHIWVCPVVRGSLLQPDIFINKMIVFYKSTLK